MLCPSCHVVFDTHLKPKMCEALRAQGVDNLPESWQTSTYARAGVALHKAAASHRKRAKSRKET